jgi:adenosine/AMP kinase
MNATLELVTIDKPADANVIIGQAHFIKTIDDLHEALVGISSNLRFGIAFCEASGACLIRHSGNDAGLERAAAAAASEIGAGHTFVILLTGGYPVNVLNAIKAVPEVCTIFCATANPVDIVVAIAERGRGIAAVVDGSPPVGVELDSDVIARRALLRELGYKL